MLDQPVLECQDCGRVLRTLSPAEAQQVADNPYNFIFFCVPCQRVKEEAQINAVTLL